MNRQFEADQLNQKWIRDITNIKTKQGFCYLTAIMVLADRMVVSWHLSNSLEADQTSLAVVKLAMQRRSIKRELIFHSDGGIQYSCTAFQQILRLNKNTCQSMIRKANCWDNAVAESFFKTLKIELIKNYSLKT